MKTLFARSVSEKAHNEDAFVCAEGFYMVADGASALGFGDYLHTGSDAAWFSHALCSIPADYMDPSHSLSDLLQARIQTLANEFGTDHLACSPSAALAMVRFNAQKAVYDYLVLADCVVLFLTKDGILRISDPAVGRLDDLVIEQMRTLAQKSGKPFLEGRKDPQIKALLLKNRSYKNTDGDYGYSCADLSANWPYALCGSIPADQLLAFALFSDGFDQIGDLASLDDTTLMNRLLVDPQRQMDLLYALQEEDAACTRVGRLKKRDDTTLVLAGAARTEQSPA